MIEYVGIVGSGSWATALVSILQQKGYHILWFVRYEEQRLSMAKHLQPLYFSSDFKLDSNLVSITTNIDDVFCQADVVLLATPSAFLGDVMSRISTQDFPHLKMVSVIKGFVTEEMFPVSTFLEKYYNLSLERFCVLTGASHAEEVIAKKKTYVSVASHDLNYAKDIASLFATPYFVCKPSSYVMTAQYAGSLKNIYAIALGIASALGYGDNFNSILISHALYEMRQLLDLLCPKERIDERDYYQSCYVGDLLVTCQSKYSRNRRFGEKIGSNSTHSPDKKETFIYPEGYYASQCMKKKIDAMQMEQFAILASVCQSIDNPAIARSRFAFLENVLY